MRLPPDFLAIIMATAQLSSPHLCAGRHLDGIVTFLLPCANMSALRRNLLGPHFCIKGGVVTNDPAVATHCLVAVQIGSEPATRLLTKFGVPATCTLVPERFLAP